MRNISSTILSLAAMVLSSLTTYLTFFDARYTLNAAVADVSGQQNRGYSSNGEQRNVNFRFYVTPTVILSNRGTRALVVSEVSLVKSEQMERCIIGDQAERRTPFLIDVETNRSSTIEPYIVEPGAVRAEKMEVSLPDMEWAGALGEEVDLEAEEAQWCFAWVVFDPNGKRHEQYMPAFTSQVTFVTEEGENYPSANFALDFDKGPTRLLSRGIF